MVFEYTPTSDTLVESFWSFSIPSQGLVVPFLLVGHVTEPRVTLDRPAINFGRVRLLILECMKLIVWYAVMSGRLLHHLKLKGVFHC
jgi:hypothetical protein